MTLALDQLAVDRSRLSSRERVLLALATLGPDELEVLAQVADGLVRGRGVYGELEFGSDPRDLVGEGLAEARDAAIYLTAALVRHQRGASHAGRPVAPRSRPAADAETPEGATGSAAREAGGRP